MQNLLGGKTVIVTGAAGDVGRTIVKRCVEEGASVVATDYDIGSLDSIVADLSADGAHIVAVKHDVTSEAEWRHVVDTAVTRFGRLDSLVNCAGITVVFFIENATLADWNRIFAVNTTGPFLGMRAALPALRDAAKQTDGGSSIVNIASAQGLLAGQPGLATYAASKGALRLLTRTAAVEFGRLGYNIRCNCVVPSALGGTSLMNSQIASQVERGVFANLEQGMKAINANFPLGHTAAPIDVAEAVVFLASDRSRSITGIDLPVDGGRCA
jgi:NAD(P)-dependent dehydrogenase (short-subunit alcohol dehydrogenase family)